MNHFLSFSRKKKKTQSIIFFPFPAFSQQPNRVQIKQMDKKKKKKKSRGEKNLYPRAMWMVITTKPERAPEKSRDFLL